MNKFLYLSVVFIEIKKKFATFENYVYLEAKDDGSKDV